MIHQDRPWTLSTAAGAGRHWLATLLARHRARLAGRQAWLDGSEESALWLEQRILATRTEIAAINRSLAMQKQALDGAWPGRPDPQDAPATGEPAAAPARLHARPGHDNSTAYADTEPMPFLDTISPASDDAA
ncbi:MAG: hypothetical protein HY855_22340 [Burkholderiales bacterium]|nr:hypothetical protein [Burkholderiales bacterium]